MKHKINARLHRQLGVELFNFTWKLLTKKRRTRAEADTMLHAAHASRYHWQHAGTAVNLARGEWQVSRVYAVLRRAEPALYHARRCLEICRAHKIIDFDLAYAYEALARASSVARKRGDVARYLRLANAAGEKIAKKEDREWFFKDLRSVPAPR